MKVLYHHPPGSIALVMTDHDYRVLTGYREEVSSPAGYLCNQMLCQTDNPLEAWTSYYDAVDCEVRRRIGRYLERHGKNRWTGESF